jgi:hypothetical protein
MLFNKNNLSPLKKQINAVTLNNNKRNNLESKPRYWYNIMEPTKIGSNKLNILLSSAYIYD